MYFLPFLRRFRYGPVLVLLLAAGCGRPVGSVSGEVTLDGKSVPNGYITFVPADGAGPIAGGPVTDGQFAVQNLRPGPKVVSVRSVLPASDAPASSEDAYAKGSRAAVPPPIPAAAVGNGQTLEVKPGPQTFNVTLTTLRR